jgi:hypothetical protein
VAELFEVDRLLGPAVMALAGARADQLEEILPARGLMLIHGDRRESRDAAGLADRLAADDRLREELRTAIWTVGVPGPLADLGASIPVRTDSGGLILWFRREEGRPVLAALEGAGDTVTDRETSGGSGPEDPGEEASTPEAPERDS